MKSFHIKGEIPEVFGLGVPRLGEASHVSIQLYMSYGEIIIEIDVSKQILLGLGS